MAAMPKVQGSNLNSEEKSVSKDEELLALRAEVKRLTKKVNKLTRCARFASQLLELRLHHSTNYQKYFELRRAIIDWSRNRILIDCNSLTEFVTWWDSYKMRNPHRLMNLLPPAERLKPPEHSDPLSEVQNQLTIALHRSVPSQVWSEAEPLRNQEGNVFRQDDE
jgi:hypothetical protein